MADLGKQRNLVLAVIVCVVGLNNHGIRDVVGHGMLLDPPNRSSIWRFRNNNPSFENATENYTDNELSCGGRDPSPGAYFDTGKCGVCGDVFNETVPRQNEDGGIYGQGIIVGTYKSGQVVPLKVNLTTSHLGYFEVRLCAKDDISSHLDESCYEKYLLDIISPSNKNLWLQKNGWAEVRSYGAEYGEDEELEAEEEVLGKKQFKKSSNNCAEKSSTTPQSTRNTRRTIPTTSRVTKKPPSTTVITSTTQRSTQVTTTRRVVAAGQCEGRQKPNDDGRITRYYIEALGEHPRDAPVEHKFAVKLPKRVKCNKCVLRWQYTAGNDWGVCEDGTTCKGCGRQEIFRNCADISIL